MKKWLITPVAILLMLLLAGCWDRTEINDLAIIVGLGLHETEDEEVQLSVQIVNPSSMASGQSGNSGQQGTGQLTTMEKEVGKTTFDARSKLQEKVSRELFSGHNRVVFISEKLAEKGIRDHIDFLARYTRPRLRSYVYVTKGVPADFFKVMPDLESSSAETARELADLRIGMSVEVKELLQMTADASENAALPIITIEGEPPHSYGLRVQGAAVFKHGKMVGQLDDSATRGVMWIRDEIEEATIMVQPEGETGYISFLVLDATTKLVPEIKGDNWTMTVQINAIDDAVENHTTLDLMKPDTIKRLEKQLEEKVEQRIHIALEQVQKDMKADILGFGESFDSKYPDKWEAVKDNWDEKFSEVTVNIESDVEIKRPGRSTSPPALPEDEVTNE
ncbi:Ger(x)C family spore germination protein [Lentibacillus persicus]|nr:Ger(x)C family spore germination protein [Lentibacillus persicus]